MSWWCTQVGMKMCHCPLSSNLLTYLNSEAEPPFVTCSRRSEPNHKDHRSSVWAYTSLAILVSLSVYWMCQIHSQPICLASWSPHFFFPLKCHIPPGFDLFTLLYSFSTPHWLIISTELSAWLWLSNTWSGTCLLWGSPSLPLSSSQYKHFSEFSVSLVYLCTHIIPSA